MASRANKDIIKAAKKQGWTVKRCQNGHFQLTPPDPNASLIHMSGTMSDWRARKKMISDLRRTGCFVWAGH